MQAVLDVPLTFLTHCLFLLLSGAIQRHKEHVRLAPSPVNRLVVMPGNVSNTDQALA